MAATPPPQVEVGARGTIASLVLQEIEYFRRVDLSHHGTSSGGGRHKSGSGAAILRKKKKMAGGGGGGFLPTLCSMVEITDTRRPESIKRIRYKNLTSEDGEASPQN